MAKVQITFVLEFLEQPTESIYPVTGRSGNCYGYASLCPKRGTYCLRMNEATFRAARSDLFTVGRRFYYPIPDVEIEVIEEQNPPSPHIALPQVQTAQEQPVDNPKPSRKRRRRTSAKS